VESQAALIQSADIVAIDGFALVSGESTAKRCPLLRGPGMAVPISAVLWIYFRPVHGWRRAQEHVKDKGICMNGPVILTRTQVSATRGEVARWVASCVAGGGGGGGGEAGQDPGGPGEGMGRVALNLQSANLLRFNKAARETILALLPQASFVFGTEVRAQPSSHGVVCSPAAVLRSVAGVTLPRTDACPDLPHRIRQSSMHWPM
jgi:hypothetical protein